MSKELFEAIVLQNVDKIKEVIKSGGDLNVKNIEGNTALMALCGFYCYDEEKRLLILNMLLNAGADPNILDDRLLTAINYAWENCNSAEKNAVVGILYAHGGRSCEDLVLRNGLQHYTFDKIIKTGSKDLIDEYIRLYPDFNINSLDEEGNNIVMLLVLEGNENLFEYFLGDLVNFNHRNKKGETLVDIVCDCYNDEIKNKLIKYMAVSQFNWSEKESKDE